MSEIQKKVCMLGAFAVGKTSLVGQFVHQKFSDRYLTTMGVKVDRKTIDYDEHTLRMMLWDLAGEDDVHQVRESYLRGMAAYLLVVDSTRAATLEASLAIHDRVVARHGALPFILVVNKTDLEDRREVSDERLALLEGMGVEVLRTSAKTGDGVDEAFRKLGSLLLENA